MLVTVISFLLVLGVLVFIHEFGHYIVAKKTGIKVEEFALGFGPKLFSRKKDETVYSIRIIPLGGFCNMAGEFIPDDDLEGEERQKYEQAEKEGKCFHQKSALTRFLVVFMGPAMNFLLAAVIFILVYSAYGLPVAAPESTIIGGLEPGQPAAEAGLEPGDEIRAINDREVADWEQVSSLIRQNEAGSDIIVTVDRDGKIKHFTVATVYNKNIGETYIGIYGDVVREKISIFRSIKLGIHDTWQLAYLIVNGLMEMITGQMPLELAGPIMMASFVGQAARVGLVNLLNLMAFISINLGLINLLPVPALDGGRIMFIIVEVLRGKPVDPKKEGFVHLIGFVLLMLLMVFVIYQDIVRNVF